MRDRPKEKNESLAPEWTLSFELARRKLTGDPSDRRDPLDPLGSRWSDCETGPWNRGWVVLAAFFR
jgi:hypothetical protein